MQVEIEMKIVLELGLAKEVELQRFGYRYGSNIDRHPHCNLYVHICSR